ncbi:MAG: EamA family transporter, partial [Candidatus Levyibacteriota bacterium]
VKTYGFFEQLTIPGIAGIVFGVFFSSLLAYYLYFWGLKHFLASETGIFSYVDPVVGVLIAIPLVHEYPNPIFLVGSFLIFFGIFLSENRIHYHPVHKLFTRG